MVNDEDPEVRRIVAARMLPDEAVKLLADPDWLVRLEVARRAPLATLEKLAHDPEQEVRDVVLDRLNRNRQHEDET